MKFAVIGGDKRMAALAKVLREDGSEVSSFALPDGMSSLEEAVAGADYIILPTPALDGEGYINTPLSHIKLTVGELGEMLCGDQAVFGGMITPELASLMAPAGVTDYFAREELTVINADLTAEAAVGIIIAETEFGLNGADVLVVGAGRIGKLLAQKLKGLGADVTLSARKPWDLAYARALGLETADTRSLSGLDKSWHIIINTVPAMVVGEDILKKLKNGGYVMDLATKPGGVDFAAAGKLGIKAELQPALPGRYSPLSAAKAIKETIYNIIGEMECPK